ncbi:MAG: glycosyltransferase family 2 protein, partial [Patescibacteria group bacterium]
MGLAEDRHHRRYRYYEMLPGTLVWGTFVLAVILSWYRPLWVIYFIIVFSLLWVFRVAYFIFYITLAWRRYQRDTRTDWWAKVVTVPGHERVRHLIFLPTYSESLTVLRQTFESLCAGTYPTNDFIVVLAGEARSGAAAFRQRAEAIRAEFGARFARLIVTVHPADLPDEIPGKGSNLNYAARQVQQLLAAEPLADPDYLIVSSFDIDTCAHREYFACLTYTFLTTPDRLQVSYQPVALYNNNMWESNPILRVAAFGTTFWLMSELMRPERLFTFSSHSMSWRMLQAVGFWEKDIVTEDSRIFLQGFLHYNGHYRVVPLFVPVSMN